MEGQATLIPQPKSLLLRGGSLRLQGVVPVAAVGDAGLGPARWLATQLSGPGRECCVADDPASARIVLDIQPELQRGAASEGAYTLNVSPHRAVLSAAEPAGLFNATACLLQLAEADAIPCVEVKDWPDFRFRVADWLLNVEINRWAYERGEGREATHALLRRKIDLAARCRLNVVWFDGFGWDPNRTPDYAQTVRGLARYARKRGIRLAHAGYGGGYGFAYQRSALYSARYMGRAYENRRPWPDGAVYDCIGEPSYPDSRHHGTCLSNDGLQRAKLEDLREFVRACEPGMLYIHDIDTGRWAPAVRGWLQRCDECRRRWPSDDPAAPDGMAGAYAAWFSRVVEAISIIQSEDGKYEAERDCELVFVGPVYTSAAESDEDWGAACRYFETLSRLIGPAANVQIGIREQLVRDDGRPRVTELAARLDAIGHGHGVFVVAFCGGDGYYSDQLLSPTPAFNGYAVGARSMYAVTLGGIAEPTQVMVAEYAWNADAPGSVEVLGDRDAALTELERARSGAWRPDDDLLGAACRALYGECAGPLVANALSATEDGCWPIAAIWPSFSREVQHLTQRREADSRERSERWRRRSRSTAALADLLRQALNCPDLTDCAREDLRWLLRGTTLGEEFASLFAATYDRVASGGEMTPTAALWEALAARLRQHSATDFTDPIGGDVAAAIEIAEAMGALCHRNAG